jgi:CubicO group peptidase (beta-lactamase class C family)
MRRVSKPQPDFSLAWSVLDQALTRGVPGIAAMVWHDGAVYGPVTRGVVSPGGQPVSGATRFAVASITKIALALAILRLVDRGALVLDAPVAELLPSARVSADARLRHLLAHTSGLPHDVDPAIAPYAPGLTHERLLEACLATPSDTPVDTRVTYSNVGFGLLGRLVVDVTGEDVATAVRRLVLDPLGMAHTGFAPPADDPTVSPVSALRGDHDPALAPYNSDFWRNLRLPWAGLFSTPADLLRLAAPFLSDPIGAGFLSPALAEQAISVQTGDLPGGGSPPLNWNPNPWGLGWELRDAKRPHWAAATASPVSFGHAGHAGAVLWADRDRRVAWAFCGNRATDNGWLLRVGPAFGDAVLAALDA